MNWAEGSRNKWGAGIVTECECVCGECVNVCVCGECVNVCVESVSMCVRAGVTHQGYTNLSTL